jgi:hypothetical protein
MGTVALIAAGLRRYSGSNSASRRRLQCRIRPMASAAQVGLFRGDGIMACCSGVMDCDKGTGIELTSRLLSAYQHRTYPIITLTPKDGE